MPSSQRRILVLGAGFVSGPVIKYLSQENIEITVASLIQDELNWTKLLCPGVKTVLMKSSLGSEEWQKQISEHDLVVSLLPTQFHVEVAKLCIKYKKNMVNSSYMTSVKELHLAAMEAGITIMCEVGVDPGIDHMLAMEVFDEVREAGGKISSFISYCGGIPAPEGANGPLRYKISWNPRAAFFNCMGGACYMKDDKMIEVEGNGRLLQSTVPLDIFPGFDIEGFPNRDSTKYLKQYGIESASSILRGTIRYKGFSEQLLGLISLRLLDTNPENALHPDGAEITWREYLCGILGKSKDISQDTLNDLVFEKLGRNNTRFQTVIDLGLLEDIPIDKKTTPLDTLSNYFASRLTYGPNERDMLLMHHQIGIESADGRKEQRNVSFVVYGDVDGFSSMAKTTGLTTGIASKMVFNGEIQQKGVIAPMTKDIYMPMLQRLKEEGLSATTSVVSME